MKNLTEMNLQELLDLYKNCIQCSYYCPVECNHFENYDRHYSENEVKEAICSLYLKSINS